MSTSNDVKVLNDPKVRAEHLLDLLRKGKGVYDIFSENFRKNYLVSGKTLETWEKHFKISIPSDLDPGKCKELDLVLMRLHEEALFHKATADAVQQALKKGSESEYLTRFEALVKEYEAAKKKLPANATLDSLAKLNLDDVESALAAARIALDFWESIIIHITFCRKLIEQGIMASGIQVKMDSNHKGNIYG
jgi:hypothetical protein